MRIDEGLLIEILAQFELGEDLSDDNPFDIDSVFTEDGANFVDGPLQAFLEGTCAETRKYVVPRADHPDLADREMAFTIAGFLQGLAAGYEYAVLASSDSESREETP